MFVSWLAKKKCITLFVVMMMCYCAAHNNMIDCKCKQGTILFGKTIRVHLKMPLRKHYTALQISILVQMIEIYICKCIIMAWLKHDFYHSSYFVFGAINHNFKLWVLNDHSPLLSVWAVYLVWILINIFLWHYKRHLHPYFKCHLYHMMRIVVTYIWIMRYNANLHA